MLFVLCLLPCTVLYCAESRCGRSDTDCSLIYRDGGIRLPEEVRATVLAAMHQVILQARPVLGRTVRPLRLCVLLPSARARLSRESSRDDCVAPDAYIQVPGGGVREREAETVHQIHMIDYTHGKEGGTRVI